MSCTQPVDGLLEAELSPESVEAATSEDQCSQGVANDCTPAKESTLEASQEEQEVESAETPTSGEETQSNVVDLTLQRPRTNSEVERYSDQVAKLFTNLAGIDEGSEEQATNEHSEPPSESAEASSDVNLPISSLNESTRMTTCSTDSDEHQDNESSTQSAQQASVSATGETSEHTEALVGELAGNLKLADETGDSEKKDKDEIDECEQQTRATGDIGESTLVADGSERPEQRREEDLGEIQGEKQPDEGLQDNSDSPDAVLANNVERVEPDDAVADERLEQQVEKQQVSSADSTFSESSSADLPEELGQKQRQQQYSGEESCCASECICNEEEEDEEEFCGETASNSTLRRLKMSTFQDVLVCEQNRQSMEAARRMFGQLVRGQQVDGLDGSGEKKQQRRPTLSKRAGSLSSAEEPEEESDEHEEERAVEEGLGESDRLLLKGFDTIKIVRRSGSSASSSNFRQTLVCSVSPTSQLEGSNLDMSISETGHPLYPIDGDEIQQCRAAFRENKRLIEEQQERALASLEQEQHYGDCGDNNATNGNRMSPSRNKTRSPLTGGTYARNNRFKQNYSDQNGQQSQCSRCHKRVYPVDKMELDFTRTTLNIHRNCFKCQICSTLLR